MEEKSVNSKKRKLVGLFIFALFFLLLGRNLTFIPRIDLSTSKEEAGLKKEVEKIVQGKYLGRNVREVNAPFDGLRLGNVVEVDSQMPGGTVIRQSPQPGDVVPRGTAVHLEVAISWVFVPDVMQRSVTAAEKIVRDAGLIPEVVGQPSSNHFVSKQDPLSGTRVRRGSRVRLWFQIID